MRSNLDGLSKQQQGIWIGQQLSTYLFVLEG